LGFGVRGLVLLFGVWGVGFGIGGLKSRVHVHGVTVGFWGSGCRVNQEDRRGRRWEPAGQPQSHKFEGCDYDSD